MIKFKNFSFRKNINFIAIYVWEVTLIIFLPGVTSMVQNQNVGLYCGVDYGTV